MPPIVYCKIKLIYSKFNLNLQRPTEIKREFLETQIRIKIHWFIKMGTNRSLNTDSQMKIESWKVHGEGKEVREVVSEALEVEPP
jgi:hypothetical protein